jgi:translation elongation factor EF-Ts
LPGYIGAYITADNTGGAIVKVAVLTDIAAQDDRFKAFCVEIACHAYMALSHTKHRFLADWKMVTKRYPNLEEARLALSMELNEIVRVTDIIIMAA